MMNSYEHLPLSPFQSEVQRQTRGGGGGFSVPTGRKKSTYSQQTTQKVNQVTSSFSSIKTKYSGIITPSLIFELEINQSVDFSYIEKTLVSMGIHILSSAENKKGFWVVFSDDEELVEFKKKLSEYGSPEGHNYDFFNAFENLRDIPKGEKIGNNLKNNPLSDREEFIDIELWRMTDEQKNISFINELKQAYSDQNQFRITDKLITKSFVLLRVKLTSSIFNEIIELKEIARADRPSLPVFNPFDLKNIDISEIQTNAPDQNASGILIIDSGIISNHPFLEKCVGGEENFQNGEEAKQDTVGHGTAVSGCAVYGDIEKSIVDKEFVPSNWIFSAKVMYAESNPVNGQINAAYDPEKLVEHQFKESVESFLSHTDYHIRVVNISIGNSQEIWHKSYNRQLPLAALIDELAYNFPNVVFIVATGNQHPNSIHNTVNDISDNYPQYLIGNENFKIINPATSALSLTVGSITPPVRIQEERYGEENIKTVIAEEHQPSPFTRTGPGINGMVKPELVEYGGNLILYENYGRISEDSGGKLLLLNNQTTGNLVHFDYGTSFSAPKIAHIAGQIANRYPQKSANFIKNMLISGANYPFVPKDDYVYCSIPNRIGEKGFENNILNKIISDSDRLFLNHNFEKNDKYYYLKKNIDEPSRAKIISIMETVNFKTNLAMEDHINVSGYGLPTLDNAISSFDNRVILFDEGSLQLNRVKVYSLQLPDIFFSEAGYKRIIITLSFTPETRASRGDSYLGNRMEFHLFHSVNPQELVNKYGVVSSDNEGQEVPQELKNFELKLFPGSRTRNMGCHQKAWKEFKREPKNRPASPVSLVLINYNKWMSNENINSNYCLSVTFEHEKEIDLYNQIRTNIQTRARVR